MEIDRIYNQDCIKGMAEKMDENSVDLIVTDPPFAIDFISNKANYNRNASNVLDDYHETASDDYEQFTDAWLFQAKRILKETGSMYVFSGWNHLEILLRIFREMGFKTINHIIWKYSFGVNCTKKYITSHYHLLYVAQNPQKVKFFKNSRYSDTEKNEDGKGKARYIDMEDVWIINRENWTGMVKTPTKLPGEIVKKILSYSSEPGDLICDPFSGSGQVAWFCKEMDRNYIAFEESKEICHFSKEIIETNRYLLSKK